MTKVAAICMLCLMAVDGFLAVIAPAPVAVETVGYGPR